MIHIFGPGIIVAMIIGFCIPFVQKVIEVHKRHEAKRKVKEERTATEWKREPLK